MATFKNRALALATVGLLTGTPVTIATNGVIQVPEAVAPPVVQPAQAGGGSAPREILFKVPYFHKSYLQFYIASELRYNFFEHVPQEVHHATFQELRLSSESGFDAQVHAEYSSLGLFRLESDNFGTYDVGRLHDSQPTFRLEGTHDTTFVFNEVAPTLYNWNEFAVTLTGDSAAQLEPLEPPLQETHSASDSFVLGAQSTATFTPWVADEFTVETELELSLVAQNSWTLHADELTPEQRVYASELRLSIGGTTKALLVVPALDDDPDEENDDEEVVVAVIRMLLNDDA